MLTPSRRSAPPPYKPPAVLAAERAETDASTRALRLRAACEALEACGLPAEASAVNYNPTPRAGEARDAVRMLRRSLLDGRDAARLTACNVALEALGRLWACS